MENTNLEWLLTLFAQPHLSKFELKESFSVKWFALKNGRALYNIKQMAIADNVEFKLFVLEELYNKVFSRSKMY